MKTFILFLAFIAVLLVAWLSVPSSLFVHPLSLRYDGERFVFVRDLPRGDQWGAVSVEIRSEIGSCPNFSILSYEERGLEPVIYSASSVCAAFIPARGEVFIVDTLRSVLIGGWFPLRPSASTWSCVVGGPDCINLR